MHASQPLQKPMYSAGGNLAGRTAAECMPAPHGGSGRPILSCRPATVSGGHYILGMQV